MERKKLIELVGSIFVALIFLSSYAAFGNISANASNATTTSQAQTVYAAAVANATIASYGGTININISCSNVTAVSGVLNAALASLEKNGSVSNFYSQQASQVLVQAGNASAYRLFLELSKDAGAGASCTQFLGSANVNLPSRVNFHVPAEKSSIIISIPQSMLTHSLPVAFKENMSSTMEVSVSAFLYLNGTISASAGGLRVAPV